MHEPHGVAVEQDFARPGGLRRAEDRLEEFRPSGTHQAGDADDLAGVNRERHVLQPVAPGMVGPGKRHAADLERHGAA